MANKTTYPLALYLEVRKGAYSQHFLYIPPTVHPDTGAVVPFVQLSRMLSADHPKRPWKSRLVDEPSYPAVSAGEFTENTPEQAAALAATVLVGTVNTYLMGCISGSWTLYKTPVVVELSPEDIRDLAGSNTPQALSRRLDRARSEAGFEESKFPVAV